MPAVVTEFTPWASLIGGILIGLSAVMVMALFGRITGIAGISTGALPGLREDWAWRLSFIAGLVAAPILVQAVTGEPVVQTVSSGRSISARLGISNRASMTGCSRRQARR